MKTAIIIDSSVGIKDLSKYKDVYLAPLMIINSKGEEIKDDDKFSDDVFWDLNETDILKTSSTVVGDMYELWDNLLKKYDSIICIFISKGLSGQYASFKMLSNEEKYANRVFIADSKAVSVIGERQLETTLKMIEDNHKPEEICNFLEEKWLNNITYIIPKSLTQLVRGGRISKAAASLAKLFKITPILKFDGSIDKEDKTRTFNKALSIALQKIIANNKGKKFVVDVAYTKCDESMLDEVLAMVTAAGCKVGIIRKLSNVIAVHTGKETIGFVPYVL